MEYHIWIGGSDIDNEGTFKWERSEDSWEYTNWKGCPVSNGDNKDCVKIASGSGGRWKVESCDLNTRRFICQKTSPTSKLLWTSILGAEYSYLENRRCIQSWDEAKSQCEDIGGNIASVLSQEVTDQYIAMFSSVLNKPKHWIGLNDKENIQS